jgi:hypothetical protein
VFALNRVLSLRTLRIFLPSDLFLEGEAPDAVRALGVDSMEKEWRAGEECWLILCFLILLLFLSRSKGVLIILSV